MRRVRGVSFDPMGMARQRYKAWKLARAKKKFQLYMKKNRYAELGFLKPAQPIGRICRHT